MPGVRGGAARVPEVIDAWFDSGSMPFAQWGAPLRNLAAFESAYPAQFICEAIDQTRGWFYSLMAVGTLVFGRSAYENVVCLGLVTDEAGRKMSKHLGNVIEPMGLMDSHGADAVRWFFAVSGSPWGQRRIGPDALDEIVRKVLLTYWNTASFLVLYANAAGAVTPAPVRRPDSAGERGRRRRLRSRRPRLAAAARPVAAVRGARVRQGRDVLPGGVRLGRRRAAARRAHRRPVQLVRAAVAPPVLGRARESPDGAAAFATLHEALAAVTSMLAPVAPFLSDYLWGVLRPRTPRRRCTSPRGPPATRR